MKAQQSMGIRMMYGDLFKKLALSPEENDQLADILAERRMDISTVAMGAMSSGGVFGEEQSKKVTDMQQRYDDQLKAVLGDENYATLQRTEKPSVSALCCSSTTARFQPPARRSPRRTARRS